MNYLQTYSDFLRKRLKVSRPLKIVCDGSNGTAGIIVKKVFGEEKAIKLTLINEKPDGRFPAHGPNPLSPGALKQCAERVRKERADFGAVFDADGDRVFFLDDRGRPIPSFLTARLLSGNHRPPLVADELVYQTLKLSGVSARNLHPSKVGSYFIKQAMRSVRADFGAEYSGHFYFKDFFYCDSGVLALINFINFISVADCPLSALVKKFPPFFTALENLPFSGRTEVFFDRLAKRFGRKAKVERRDGLTLIFKSSFLNVRASNTEPLLRLTAGSKTEKAARQLIEQFKKSAS